MIGLVVNVTDKPLGSALAVDAPTGTTVLDVFDVGDYRGGTVQVGGAQYSYTALDYDANTVTLSSGLTADAFAGDLVQVWDNATGAVAVQRRAYVAAPGDVGNDEPLDAVVKHQLVPYLPEGIRAPGAEEHAELTDQGGGRWVVSDLLDKFPQFDGSHIAPSSVPQAALGFTLPDGTKVTIATTAPTSPADGDLWFDETNGNTLKKWNASTSTWDPFQFGTGAVSFNARDLGGVTTTIASSAPASPLVNDLWFDSANGYKLNQWNGTAWVAVQFGTNAIAAGSITAALIAANTITAAQIAGGTITATQLAANSVTASQIAANAVTAAKLAAGIIVAGIVDATTITGAQFVATGTAGEVLVYDGTPGAGNLIFAVSGSTGSDAHSNTFSKGVSLAAEGTAGKHLEWINQQNHADTASGPVIWGKITGTPFTWSALVLQGPDNSSTTGIIPAEIDLGVGGTVTALADSIDLSGAVDRTSTVLLNNNGVAICNGPPGKYYASEQTFSQGSVASGSTVQITNRTAVKEHTDYANPWSGMTFTAPVDSYYDAMLNFTGISGSNNRAIIRRNSANLAVGDPTSANTDATATAVAFWMNAGDTLTFLVRQTSGSNQTVTGRVNVAHRP